MDDIDSSSGCCGDDSDDTGSSNGSSDSSGWDEIMTDDPMVDGSAFNVSSVSCLFCPQIFRSVEDAIKHCSVDHQFDLVNLKTKLNMDCYSYIKMINYIRSIKPDPGVLTESVIANNQLWQDDKYLKPVLYDDPWLLFDFDDMEEMEFGNGSSTAQMSYSGSCGHHVNAENGRVTLSETHFSELQKKIQELYAQVRVKESLLKDAEDAICRMRQTLNNVITSENKSDTNKLNSVPRCVSSVDVKDDHCYFNSYSHFGIHHEMLSDKVRTNSYRDAISQCVTGKNVMDLGCGTGILSMFAATAGANKIIAIDQSDIVYQAIDIIRENGLDQRINVIKGRLEDTIFPKDCDKFDVIVSEWMGYFLLFEGMLDSVIYARDHHLAPGGLLLPNRCSVSIAGFSSPGRYEELIGFWSNVYGYKMSCMKREVVGEALVEVMNHDEQITDTFEVFTIDLMTATVDSVNFVTEFKLNASRDGELTSIVGHFDVFFDLKNSIFFSTGPSTTPTHWKQTVFFLKQPISVKQGEVLYGKMICQRHKKEVRSLTVTIVIKDQKQIFMLH
ncbi:arginine methyltransferase 3 [Lycorma delicatula]|uniref:arginine methyltransferase 3 n=1 Tax=Lycorma delicatula TaxID=130591 RepID=UPI003F50F79E